MIIIQERLEFYGIIVEMNWLIDGAIFHLNVANAITDPFEIKEKLTSKAGNDGTKKVRIVLLKYLSNFWRPLKIPLVNCKTNLDLNWSKTCVIDNNADKYTAFS